MYHCFISTIEYYLYNMRNHILEKYIYISFDITIKALNDILSLFSLIYIEGDRDKKRQRLMDWKQIYRAMIIAKS